MAGTTEQPADTDGDHDRSVGLVFNKFARGPLETAGALANRGRGSVRNIRSTIAHFACDVARLTFRFADRAVEALFSFCVHVGHLPKGCGLTTHKGAASSRWRHKSSRLPGEHFTY